MKYHPWEVLVINIDMQPRKRRKKKQCAPWQLSDSCCLETGRKVPVPAFHWGNDNSPFPAMQIHWLQSQPLTLSGTKMHILCMGFRSKFWILIHWMPTLRCCVKQTLLAHVPMWKIGIDKGVYDNEWAKGCSVENKISKSGVSVSSQ